MTNSSRAPGLTRIVLIVVGALVALVVVAWGALWTLLPPAKVRALVETQARQALAREVRLGGASVGLLPPVRLAVRDVALAEPGGFAEGAAFQARALLVDVDPFALLARKVVVRRLTLDRPALHLVLRADGTTNFDGLLKSAPGGAVAAPRAAPMDVAIQQFSIRDGNLLVDDLKARRRTALAVGTRTSLALEGGSRVATAGVTRLSGLARGPLSAARLSDLDQSLARVEWRIEHRGKFDSGRKRLALEKLALAFGRASLDCSGLVDDPGPKARIDLHARGQGVDLGEILDVLSAADARALSGVRGDGRLGFDLRIVGALGPGRLPNVTGSLGVSEASFRYPGAAASVSDLSFTARFAPDSVGIGDLRCRVSDQPVRAAFTAERFADPIVTFAVQGNLDLAAVAPMVAPKDTRLAGRADVDVRGRGRAKDPGGVALQGAARLSGVSVESPALPKKVEQVSGTVRFSPASARVQDLTARAGRSSFTLDATVTRPLAVMGKPGEVAPAGVDFSLDSPYLDLAELLPPTPGPTVLPNAEGGGRVRIGRLIQQRLDVSDVRAQVAMTPRTLSVPSFSLRGYDGDVSGSAAFDLDDPASPGFQVKARVDSISADALLSAWTPAKGFLRGVMSSDLDLAGDGTSPEDLKRSLTAVGLAALFDGQIGPGPALEAIAALVKMPSLKEAKFKDLRLPFQVEHGRVATREVDLKTSAGDWKLSGAVGFDGSLDYAVSITVPADQVARLGTDAARAAGALADPQGRLLIDLKVGGTAKAPKVSWDTRATRDRLAGRVSQAITEQRARLESELAQVARERLLGIAADSARRAGAPPAVDLDSLGRRAKDVLKGFFGGSKPAPPAPAPSPAPAPAPADTAKADSAKG
jgi:uncharacterized protein involved in outer membrane biogenesis